MLMCNIVGLLLLLAYNLLTHSKVTVQTKVHTTLWVNFWEKTIWLKFDFFLYTVTECNYKFSIILFTSTFSSSSSSLFVKQCLYWKEEEWKLKCTSGRIALNHTQNTLSSEHTEQREAIEILLGENYLLLPMS
jgi:hypothetical protein